MNQLFANSTGERAKGGEWMVEAMKRVSFFKKQRKGIERRAAISSGEVGGNLASRYSSGFVTKALVTQERHQDGGKPILGRWRRWTIPFLCVTLLAILLWLLSEITGCHAFFHTILAKLLGRILSSVLLKSIGGFSAGVALALVVSALQALIAASTPDMVFGVMPGAAPAPSGSAGHPGPERSSSFSEDSLEIGVLLEPFSETDTGGASSNPQIPAGVEGGDASSSGWTEFDLEVLLESEEEGNTGNQLRNPEAPVRNLSFESSLKNRIFRLGREQSPFLQDKEAALYWREIQHAFEAAPSQQEYNRLLAFEGRDLQIRELEQQCLLLAQRTVTQFPAQLSGALHEIDGDNISSFFDELRRGLPAAGGNPLEADLAEIELLRNVIQDIEKNGPLSGYMHSLLGLE